MTALFWVPLFLLVYVWLIYPVAICLLASIRKPNPISQLSWCDAPKVSIIVAAHNEAGTIGPRLRNVAELDYPKSQLEVIVVSDGSTDDTVDRVKEIETNGYPLDLCVLTLSDQSGKATAHNRAVQRADGEILVFTDAETTFEADFLQHIVAPFKNSLVGFTTGLLKFRETGGGVQESVGVYWRIEMHIRSWESRIGILATGTGACCAVRKRLFREIPKTGDVDFTTPLDVVLEGSKCIHCEKAVAYDSQHSDPGKEYAARVRMTSKNFRGTLARWGLRGLLLRPLVSIALFSHKIGRWISPFMMLMTFAGALYLWNQGGVYQLATVGQCILIVLAVLGRFGLGGTITRRVYAFFFANIAFAFGVIAAMRGKVPAAWSPHSGKGVG